MLQRIPCPIDILPIPRRAHDGSNPPRYQVEGVLVDEVHVDPDDLSVHAELPHRREVLRHEGPHGIEHEFAEPAGEVRRVDRLGQRLPALQMQLVPARDRPIEVTHVGHFAKHDVPTVEPAEVLADVAPVGAGQQAQILVEIVG